VTQHEYNQLRDQIEQDYREKLRALELVWTLSQSASSRNGNGKPAPSVDLAADRVLETAVRRVLSDLPFFSIAEVDRKLHEANLELTVKRSHLQALIRRMVASGEVVFVEGRRGKPNAIYRRSDSKKIMPLKARARTVVESSTDLLDPIKTAG
jgi:hypothetical protein